MYKKLLFLLLLLIPFYVNALDYPKTDAKIVQIYDLTDEKILYEIGTKDKISIASLTKIATTITAIENIDNLDEKVTITREMLNTVSNLASTAGLKAGDRVTYRDLLYASLLPSGADATNSLAILSSGSIANFVTKMNQLVEKIGLTDTHFVNTTGLDTTNHYSTIDDIRKLLIYALNNETFRKIYTTRNYTLSNGLKVESTIYMYNPGNRVDTSRILGSKSGYTKNAGYCLSSLSNINGHEVIIFVLKATHQGNYYNNVVDSVNLINFLIDNYRDEILVNKGQLIKTIKVKLSNIDTYSIKASNDVIKYLPSDYDKDKIKIEYKGLEELSYKNKKKDKIGTINYYYDNVLISSEDVLINKEIKVNVIKLLLAYWYLVLLIMIIIILLLIKLFHKKKRKRIKKKLAYA